MNAQNIALEMMSAVRETDWERIESDRGRVSEAVVELLVVDFHSLADDYQRAAFAMLLCDKVYPQARKAMEQVLLLPDTEDVFNMARAVAVDHFNGRVNSVDWQDKQALNEAVTTRIAEPGLRDS